MKTIIKSIIFVLTLSCCVHTPQSTVETDGMGGLTELKVDTLNFKDSTTFFLLDSTHFSISSIGFQDIMTIDNVKEFVWNRKEGYIRLVPKDTIQRAAQDAYVLLFFHLHDRIIKLEDCVDSLTYELSRITMLFEQLYPELFRDKK